MHTKDSNMQKRGIRPWLIAQQAKGKLYTTVDELKAAFPNSGSANLKMAVRNAVKDKLMAYAWRGFYLILPPAYGVRGTLPPAFYIDALMKYLKRPYCVSLLNAAEVYGAAHQKPMSFTVMTSNPPPRDRKTAVSHLAFVGNRSFNSGIPAELVRRIKVQTGYVTVATPEYTALSLVMHAKSSGGMSHVLTVLEELQDECHFEKLPNMMARYIPTPCFQRLGYMLEFLLGNQDAGAHLHDYLRKNCQKTWRRVQLNPAVSARSDAAALNKRWRVFENTILTSDSDDS